MDTDGDGICDNQENNDGTDPNDPCDPNPSSSACPSELSVKVLLQGAFQIGDLLMTDNLRSGGYLPLTEPYNGHAGSGGGETTTTTILNTNTGTSDAIVDWVFVELRDANDSTIIVETRSALLQRDGDVVDPSDGVSPLSILGANGASYYIAVKHRNHLGVMTATPVTLSNAGTIVDFTSAVAADLYNLAGYDGYEMASVNGMNALWAGDANSDSKVKYQGGNSDSNNIFLEVLTFPGNDNGSYNYDFAFGYFRADTNMDGKAKYQGSNNDNSLLFLNIVINYGLNSGSNYNYDSLIEQLPK